MVTGIDRQLDVIDSLLDTTEISLESEIKLVKDNQLIQASGHNSIPHEGCLSRAELNIELQGPGFDTTGKPVILLTNDVPSEIMDISLNSLIIYDVSIV